MLEEFVDEENQLTEHIFTGVILGKDVIEAVKALYAAGPTLNHLWDLTEADMSAVKSEDLQQIALIAKQYSSSDRAGRTAIVSNSDLGYGLGRMYSSFADLSGHSAEVRSFRSRKEAEEWIAEKK